MSEENEMKLEDTGHTVAVLALDLLSLLHSLGLELAQVAQLTEHTKQIDPQQEPLLEIKEIQGNVLAGFNKDHQMLLCLEITELNAAKEWLRNIIPNIATLEEVLAFKKLFEAISNRRAGKFGSTVQATWVNIAFSFAGLKKLTGDADQLTDSAFKEGLHSRSEHLGDPTDENAEGNCNNWVIGGPNRIPDILLIIASDDRNDLLEQVAQIQPNSSDGLRTMFKQEGEAPPPPNTSHELFGFRDGISQPGVRGRVSDNQNDLLTPRMNPTDPNQGKLGQNLVWPGEFVFGYPHQDPTDQVAPGSIAEAVPQWTRNGSYLVFRRYRQDVEAFQGFVRSAAVSLASQGISGLTPEELGAKLIGRWASGTPIVRSPDSENLALANDTCANNHFTYMTPGQPIIGRGADQCTDNEFPQAPADDKGLLCPHAAHIRKAYPRDDLAHFGAEAETHRVIRRGIPFGRPLPAVGERGLLFLCYQTSIERQFEFIIQKWINNPDFRDRGDGCDPIIGQNRSGFDPARTFVLPIQDTEGSISKLSINLPADWVIPTGGGYFFAPSISALKQFAR